MLTSLTENLGSRVKEFRLQSELLLTNATILFTTSTLLFIKWASPLNL